MTRDDKDKPRDVSTLKIQQQKTMSQAFKKKKINKENPEKKLRGRRTRITRQGQW